MQPKKLARALIDKGLVEKFVIDQTLVKLKAKETLADRLVTDNAIAEADLLRAVAQLTGTKFISSARLNDLRVPADVLELIPLAAAQEIDVLPLAYNPSHQALTVVIADPEQLGRLDALPRVGKMEAIVANIAMPSAIRAAIRRLHRLDKTAPLPPINLKPTGACSQCKEPYYEDQLECAKCGLLLNANAPIDSSEARIVRALLSQPSGLHRVPSRLAVHEGPTRRGLPMQVNDDQTPELDATLEIARSLSEFEAFVVSFVDAKMTVAQLSEASGLMAVEVKSVIASLVERKVLRLREPPPPPPPVPLNTPPVPPPTGLKRRPGQSPKPPPPPLQVPRHLNPQVQMENAIQSALALERRGQVDGAIHVLRSAISRAPHPAPLYNRLALVILNQRKDAKAAEELIQKAIELEPENPVFKENLIKVLAFAAVGR